MERERTRKILKEKEYRALVVRPNFQGTADSILSREITVESDYEYGIISHLTHAQAGHYGKP